MSSGGAVSGGSSTSAGASVGGTTTPISTGGTSSGTGGTAATAGTAGHTGGAAATGGAKPSGGSSPTGGVKTTGGNPATGGADAFWGDTTNIPAPTNVLMFKFLNRSNEALTDSQIYWSFQNTNAGINELHSILEQDTYDMPANSSGRMYFYVVTNPPDPAGSASSPRTSTFAQSRTATFAEFIAEVPAEFAHLAQPPFAPYRIVQPGAGQFKTGGTHEHYYDSWIDQLWASNNITVAKPGANCNPIQQPTLSAACYRHVGLGALNPDGTLKNGNTLWQDATTFYPVAPADYYAKFWHDHAQNGKAYGFPYDDVGSWSSYISHKNPQYMLVAIGW